MSGRKEKFRVKGGIKTHTMERVEGGIEQWKGTRTRKRSDGGKIQRSGKNKEGKQKKQFRKRAVFPQRF